MTQIEIPRNQIDSYCKKWKISEFALFGSVLRDDFTPDSDVDVPKYPLNLTYLGVRLIGLI